MITFVNYSTRTIIFGPAYGTAYKNNALTLSALPSEPESEILSIKLRRQNHREKRSFPEPDGKYSTISFYISIFFVLLRPESVSATSCRHRKQ